MLWFRWGGTKCPLAWIGLSHCEYYCTFHLFAAAHKMSRRFRQLFIIPSEQFVLVSTSSEKTHPLFAHLAQRQSQPEKLRWNDWKSGEHIETDQRTDRKSITCWCTRCTWSRFHCTKITPFGPNCCTGRPCGKCLLYHTLHCINNLHIRMMMTAPVYMYNLHIRMMTTAASTNILHLAIIVESQILKLNVTIPI